MTHSDPDNKIKSHFGYRVEAILATIREQLPFGPWLNDMNIQHCKETEDLGGFQTPQCQATRDVVANRERQKD